MSMFGDTNFIEMNEMAYDSGSYDGGSGWSHVLQTMDYVEPPMFEADYYSSPVSSDHSLFDDHIGFPHTTYTMCGQRAASQDSIFSEASGFQQCSQYTPTQDTIFGANSFQQCTPLAYPLDASDDKDHIPLEFISCYDQLESLRAVAGPSFLKHETLSVHSYTTDPTVEGANETPEAFLALHEGFIAFDRDTDSYDTPSANTPTNSPTANDLRLLLKQRRRTSRASRPCPKRKNKSVAKETVCASRKPNNDDISRGPLQYEEITLKGVFGKTGKPVTRFVCREEGCYSQVQYLRLEHLRRHVNSKHYRTGNIRCPIDNCLTHKGEGVRPDNFDQHLPTHVKDAKDKVRRNDRMTLEQVEAVIFDFYGAEKAACHIDRLRRNVMSRRLKAKLKALLGRNDFIPAEKVEINSAVKAGLANWARACNFDKALIITSTAEQMAGYQRIRCKL